MNGLPPEGIEERRQGKPRGWFGNFKTWLRRERKTTNLQFLIAVIVFLAAGGWVLLGFQNAGDQRVADVEFQRRVDDYQSDLQAYTLAVSARDLCVDGVGRSDNNREQWVLAANYNDQFAAFIEGLGGDVAAEAAERMRELNDENFRKGPVLSQEPRKLEDCPPVPTLPIPPTR